MGVVGFTARQVHVMVDYPPNQCVVLPGQSSGCEDGHHFGKLHDKGFEKQGETAVGFGPRDSDAGSSTLYSTPRCKLLKKPSGTQ